MLEMRMARIFIKVSAMLFMFAATAKFISSFGHGKILLALDPLIDLPFRDLFRLAGGVEMAVALFCFFSKQVWLPAGLVAWLATMFITYRAGLIWIGWHSPCPCLGNLTDALHIPPPVADNAMKIVLMYLLVGSYATLFWLWRQNKKTVSVSLPV